MNGKSIDGLKILHLPDLVGGHPTALSAGEKFLGANSHTLSLTSSPFGYRSDFQLRMQQSGAFPRWGERLLCFAKIRNRFDVFHFNFGTSLLNAHSGRVILGDLTFYPKGSVKVMTYQGSDARLAYNQAIEDSADEERRLGNGVQVDAFWKSHNNMLPIRHRAIEKADRYCDQLIALNPDLLNFLPSGKAVFLPYAITDPQLQPKNVAVEARSADRILHIVHLSTSRLLKGTGIIEKALANLQKNLPLTYEVVFRQDRSSAIAALRRADLVVDQMVLGWYGAAAVEAMWLEKPVIGFIDPKQLAEIPEQMAIELPIIRANTTNLGAVIENVFNDLANLEKVGAQSRAFAQKWHLPQNVAETTLATYCRLMR